MTVTTSVKGLHLLKRQADDDEQSADNFPYQQDDNRGGDANTDEEPQVVTGDVVTAEAVQGEYIPSVAEQLRALAVEAQVDADMALGEIKHRVREAAEAAGVLASVDEISVEGDRIWASFGAIRKDGGPHIYDVDPHGNVRDWRRPDPGVQADETDEDAEDAASELPGMPPRVRREEPKSASGLMPPPDSAFGDDEYLISSGLESRALQLRRQHPERFAFLDAALGSTISVVYLWKRAGGKAKGVPVFGGTKKLTGLDKLFAEATFAVWIAADTCRDQYYKDAEIEQTLFHQMLFMGVGDMNPETGRGGGAVIKPTQLNIFHAEIETYGLEAAIMREAAPLFRAAVAREEEPDPTLGDDLADPEKYSDPMGNPPPDPMPAEGILCHEDGTPLTAEEIAAHEAAAATDYPCGDYEPAVDVPVEEDGKPLCASCGYMAREHVQSAVLAQEGTDSAPDDDEGFGDEDESDD